jgi:hypothetical protein
VRSRKVSKTHYALIRGGRFASAGKIFANAEIVEMEIVEMEK